jgi:hypothetical protein
MRGQTGDAMGRASWRSPFLGDPGATFLCGKLKRGTKKEKSSKKERTEGLWKLTLLMEIRKERGFPQQLEKSLAQDARPFHSSHRPNNKDLFIVILLQARSKTMERHVCQFQIVSTEGFTPSRCAQFCAHPRSKTIAKGNSRTGERIACTSTENQQHSKLSHLVGIGGAATVNRRVASSNLARGAKSFSFSLRHARNADDMGLLEFSSRSD